MKRVFFLGVIIYSIGILLLMDWPAAASLEKLAAAPWIAKCLVDITFVLLAVIAAFGDKLSWDDEEEGIHADDVKVSGQWLYGLFGLNLLANFGWHGYEFASQTGAVAFYNSLWFFGEFLAMMLTFILWKHAHVIALREARRSRKPTLAA